MTLPKAAGAHRRVWLTHAGDDLARSLLDFYRCPDSWLLFRGMTSAVEKGPGRWMNVSRIAEALDASEESAWSMLYPLLCRGLVDSTVSSARETVFTVRPEQWETAAGERPELLADPDPDARLNPIYWSAYDAAEAEKAGWKPRRENCCYIPVLN